MLRRLRDQSRRRRVNLPSCKRPAMLSARWRRRFKSLRAIATGCWPRSASCVPHHLGPAPRQTRQSVSRQSWPSCVLSATAWRASSANTTPHASSSDQARPSTRRPRLRRCVATPSWLRPASSLHLRRRRRLCRRRLCRKEASSRRSLRISASPPARASMRAGRSQWTRMVCALRLPILRTAAVLPRRSKSRREL